MESFDDRFIAELRELRPAPRPTFVAELDERAATGFPRRPDNGGGKSLWQRLRAWFAGLTPRQALVPGGAVALVAVVVATAVVAISNSGSASDEAAVTSAQSSEAGGAIEAAPAQKAAPRNEEEGVAEEESGAEAGEALNGLEQSSESAKGGGVELEGEESSGGAAYGPTEVHKSSAGKAGEKAPEASATNSGPSPRNRDIERSASIVLGTTPDKLSEASARVYEAVHQANGIVLHSTTRGSRHGGEASFDLLIPSGRLNNTLATFSGIAEVRSRHDATTDITAPTVNVSEELQDSNARIEGLVAQLGEAESDAEREAVEGELRGERDHHAQIRASLERLEDRASMSRVSLRIVSGHGAGVTPNSDSGSWGAGDALHDAGHILAVAAGVAIIGLAILGPIALILLAAWLLNRFRVRRLRERTLG